MTTLPAASALEVPLEASPAPAAPPAPAAAPRPAAPFAFQPTIGPSMVQVFMPMPGLSMPTLMPVQPPPVQTLPTLLGRRDIVPNGPQVSKGSALHGTGQCQPCAWFWKPGRGCQSGETCGYCHLCPEGELKSRKKAKVRELRRASFERA
jgi:hypothetical protein